MTDQNIKDYINSSLLQGISKEDIYKNLLSQGFSVSSIQETFDEIDEGSERGEETQKKTIRVVLLIAAILVGAGIFSFVASNWQYMGKPTKIFLILFFMLISYALGWFSREEKGYTKVGMALYLLGLIIYGAGIFLVAQMFNIRTNWPDGFILWMLGVIGFSVAIETVSLLYLAILLGFVVIVGDPFSIFSNFGGGFSLLIPILLLLVSTAATFLVGHAIRRKVLSEEREYY